jgi:hypothetical protein
MDNAIDSNAEIKKVNPFVIDGKPDPEQKTYLLLLIRVYPGEDESKDWIMIVGRSAARQYIIDNIETIDPHQSYVAVEGTEGSKPFKPDYLPTVWTMFTSEVSPWADKNLFPDGFDITDYEVTLQDSVNSNSETVSISLSDSYDPIDLMRTDGVDV